MDRALKERLLGASILIVIAVLVIPEFLSGPSKRGVARGAVSLSSIAPTPSNTVAPLKTYTVDLNRRAASLTAPGESSASQDTRADEGANPPQVERVPAEHPAERAAEQENPAAMTALAGASEEAARAAAPTIAAPSASAPPAAAPPPDKLRASDLAHAADAPRAAAGSGWLIQLGSFASGRNADRLVRDVRRAGVHAYVVKQGSQRRVRAGPFADRAAADAAAAKLRAQGRSVSIISP